LCDFEIEFDLFLARGLGYYTGPVYEIKLSEGMGTVIAGGRYDDLLGIYGQPFPAVGISVGIERLVTLIGEQKKATKKTDSVVAIAAVKPEFYPKTMEFANHLRDAGIPCETDLNERTLRKQLDYANSLSIPFVAIIGEREAKEGKVTLREMESGEERQLTFDEAVNAIKGR
jgi:histidyl-tRNA synthetase